MSGQIMHTVCMDTRDSTKNEKDPGAFTFKLAGDNPRAQAVRVSLGSLEFPIVQWTIEEDWCRLYFSEGFRLTNEMAAFRIYERADSNDGNEYIVRLPPHLNPIQKIEAMGGGTVITCMYPHGLWVNQGSGCILSVIEWAEVEVICSVIGRVSLTALFAMGLLHYISENSFRIPEIDCDSVQAGYVHVPTYPSPSHLCETITYALAHLETRARYEMNYDVIYNKATLRASDYPLDVNRLQLRLYGSELTQLLGYTSPVHDKIFVRPKVRDQRAGDYNFNTGIVETDTHPPLVLLSDHFAGWHYVQLPPGWYAPTHRPMCTGAPLRLQSEIQFALNRLNFQRSEKVMVGSPSGSLILFSDPSGTHHLCHIYHGQYTAESLAACLETEMTRLASRSLPGTLFTVEYIDCRFTFACEVRDQKTRVVRAAPFGLFMPHPNSIDPQRLGFDGTLYGRDSYTSPNVVNVPSMRNKLLRPATNIYSVSELGHQKRLCIAPQPPPPLVGLITAYDVNTFTLRMRVYASQFPYAHGLIPGDIIQIASVPTQNISLLKMNNRGVWAEESVQRCPLAPMWGRSGIVVEDDNVNAGFPMPNSEQVNLTIRVRPTVDLVSCIDMAVSLRIDMEPFNLCFGMPKSVPNKTLGFHEGATQWGIDGSIPSGNMRIPPFIAPAVHSLDHPDYVLMYISEGKYGTTLQHSYASSTTSPFAKIVLYPIFREERMLPRDTSLLSGESLAHFTIRFTNPDGTPYHFHNIDFSFSLNFVRQLPSGS